MQESTSFHLPKEHLSNASSNQSDAILNPITYHNMLTTSKSNKQLMKSLEYQNSGDSQLFHLERFLSGAETYTSLAADRAASLKAVVSDHSNRAEISGLGQLSQTANVYSGQPIDVDDIESLRVEISRLQFALSLERRKGRPMKLVSGSQFRVPVSHLQFSFFH
jgi:hypothetical protein